MTKLLSILTLVGVIGGANFACATPTQVKFSLRWDYGTDVISGFMVYYRSANGVFNNQQRVEVGQSVRSCKLYPSLDPNERTCSVIPKGSYVAITAFLLEAGTGRVLESTYSNEVQWNGFPDVPDPAGGLTIGEDQ
jgi:hypothetical protein